MNESYAVSGETISIRLRLASFDGTDPVAKLRRFLVLFSGNRFLHLTA